MFVVAPVWFNQREICQLLLQLFIVDIIPGQHYLNSSTLDTDGRERQQTGGGGVGVSSRCGICDLIMTAGITVTSQPGSLPITSDIR